MLGTCPVCHKPGLVIEEADLPIEGKPGDVRTASLVRCGYHGCYAVVGVLPTDGAIKRRLAEISEKLDRLMAR